MTRPARIALFVSGWALFTLLMFTPMLRYIELCCTIACAAVAIHYGVDWMNSPD